MQTWNRRHISQYRIVVRVRQSVISVWCHGGLRGSTRVRVSACLRDVNVIGCWFHYAQTVIKRVQKLGLRDEYMNDANVQGTVRCLLGLPLLPAGSICEAFEDVTFAVVDDNVWGSKVNDLLRYVRRQWLQKRSIGPERLCMRNSRSRTNNILCSFILTFQCFFSH